jgi:hypothetical protein
MKKSTWYYTALISFGIIIFLSLLGISFSYGRMHGQKEMQEKYDKIKPSKVIEIEDPIQIQIKGDIDDRLVLNMNTIMGGPDPLNI